LPAAYAGDSGTLRAGTATPYPEAAPLAAAAAALQSAPDAVRDAATATKKNLLEAMSGSLPPLPQMQSAAPPPATVDAIATPVGAPGWGAEVAQKVAQVIFLRSETAEIRLNPPQLGPVDVRISFATDQPSVLITAPDPTTRSALEQALPHLRDLLAQQGITLGQASVQGERQPQQAFAPPERGPGGFAATSAHAAAEVPPRTARPDWLVDLYA
jgi:flagellar hook-length control protein FliK